jgi:cell fate regulator YaaT (PSP1 superfamily)
MVMPKVVGIRFKKNCKIYDFNAKEFNLKKGEKVIVETERGMGIGWVLYGPVEKDKKKIKFKLKSVIRKASERDILREEQNMDWEKNAFKVCAEKVEKFGLDMKLISVDYLFDGSKAIFYFTADGRIDFRDLVKALAAAFHTRIEMRQVGVRDEAKLLGGIGPCGREVCCHSFLADFEPVTIKMAKEQNLAVNPAKLSGVCGRLMCCLIYEHESYCSQGVCKKKSKVAASIH